MSAVALSLLFPSPLPLSPQCGPLLLWRCSDHEKHGAEHQREAEEHVLGRCIRRVLWVRCEQNTYNVVDEWWGVFRKRIVSATFQAPHALATHPRAHQHAGVKRTRVHGSKKHWH